MQKALNGKWQGNLFIFKLRNANNVITPYKCFQKRRKHNKRQKKAVVPRYERKCISTSNPNFLGFLRFWFSVALFHTKLLKQSWVFVNQIIIETFVWNCFLEQIFEIVIDFCDFLCLHFIIYYQLCSFYHLF